MWNGSENIQKVRVPRGVISRVFMIAGVLIGPMGLLILYLLPAGSAFARSISVSFILIGVIGGGSVLIVPKDLLRDPSQLLKLSPAMVAAISVSFCFFLEMMMGARASEFREYIPHALIVAGGYVVALVASAIRLRILSFRRKR